VPTLPMPPSAGPDTAGARAATAVAAVRAVAGAALLAAPALVPRLLGADAVTARRVGYLGRMVGVRDVALALGVLRALRAGEDARPWTLAGVLSDTGDALAVTTAVRRGDVSRLPGVLLAASAVGGAVGGLRAVRLLRAGA